MFPRYSTDLREAKKVVAYMKAAWRVTMVSGRTSVPGRPWFARIVTIGDHGTEVLAETWPLAICRLALIYAARKGPPQGRESGGSPGPFVLTGESRLTERGTSEAGAPNRPFS